MALREAVECALRAAADRHVIALGEKCFGETEPDTSGAAGDEDDALCSDDVTPIVKPGLPVYI